MSHKKSCYGCQHLHSSTTRSGRLVFLCGRGEGTLRRGTMEQEPRELHAGCFIAAPAPEDPQLTYSRALLVAAVEARFAFTELGDHAEATSRGLKAFGEVYTQGADRAA